MSENKLYELYGRLFPGSVAPGEETALAKILKDKNKFHVLLQRFAILIATTLLLIVLMTSVVTDSIRQNTFRTSDIANYNVVSARDFSLENTQATEKERQLAGKSVRKVFVLDDTAEVQVSAQLKNLFNSLLELSNASRQDETKNLELDVEGKMAFQRQYRIVFTEEEWPILLNRQSWAQIESELSKLLDQVFRQGILPNKRMLENALSSNGAVLKNKSSGHEIDLMSDDAVLDLKEATDLFDTAIPTNGFGRGAAFDSIIGKLGHHLIKPNVFFDSGETENRIQEAKKEVAPVMYHVRRGEVIVRAGDVVTQLQQEKLQELRIVQSGRNLARTVIGFFILTCLIILTVYFFTASVWPDFRPSNRDLGLMALVQVGSFFLVKVYLELGLALSVSFPDVDPTSLVLAAPVAAGGVLLQVTLGAASVFFFTTTFALLSGIFLQDSWIFLLLIIIGNIIGAICVKNCSRRSAFLSAGFRVANINMIIVFCFLLLYPPISNSGNAVRVLCALFGGFSSGILAAGLAPVAEYIGSYVTDIKLLELASLDRPLLRELAMEAPGTWNHSVTMGQLAESAGEAIGANGLLCRVGAYYHDIGKARKPEYFTENQAGIENKHDKLTPSMSALIIKSHVKDGMEMARLENLPQALLDFIPQHHGTSVIEYFFEKAKKEIGENEEVDESHYRYPGPKPQTKESGILMLADHVEASCRALSDPSPTKIKGLVQKMINKVFASGQLNESALTLRDLHLIAKSFTRVLNGIYHRRVQYSETQAPAEKSNEETFVIAAPEAVIGDRSSETNNGTSGGTNSGRKKGEGSGRSKSKKEASEAGSDKSADKTIDKKAQEDSGESKSVEGRSAREAGSSKKNGGAASEKGRADTGPDPLKRLGM